MKDQKEYIFECIQILKRGGLILYPTDTVWGIGCDATNAEAIEKIYELCLDRVRFEHFPN